MNASSITHTPSKDLDTADNRSGYDFAAEQAPRSEIMPTDAHASGKPQNHSLAEPPIPNTVTPLTETDILIPELADKYTLLSVIGRGNQGSVYLARANDSQKLVAIKQIPIDSVSSWKAYDLFHREVDTLSKLDMPGVARFHEAAEHLSGNRPAACIVQDYIEGRTLAEMLKRGHSFSLTRTFDLARQLVEILQKLHCNNPPIIHRDIKPSNIILTPSATGFDVTLIDFGAVANPQIQSGGSTLAGTYGYMPPEQITGHPVPASDIYALGVMLVTLISGVLPENLQVKDFRLIIDPHLENIPPQIVPILRQMTEPLVQNRLADHEKLRRIFHDFSNGLFITGEYLPVADFDDNDFDAKLRKVNSLAQSGNVELWQCLGDSSSRHIPKSYTDLKLRDIPETRPISKLMTFFTTNPLSIAVMIFFIIFILIYYSLGMMFYLPWYIFLFTLPIIACLVFFIHSYVRCARHKFVYDMYMEKFENSLAKLKSEYLTLLHTGRRTMATVIDIQYHPPKFSDIRILGQFNRVCNQPAAFHIRYKFNPPDDDNPNDLIRTYICPNEPDIHPGDPLPILYMMDLKNHKNVTSMPFPIPLNDVSDLHRIISSKDS
ncbi:MAG: serine/threonine protein kinase [Proteobacteria bacterium]|nr:serine/threonine protein kinase [Pseudomonadota bacterium]